MRKNIKIILLLAAILIAQTFIVRLIYEWNIKNNTIEENSKIIQENDELTEQIKELDKRIIVHQQILTDKHNNNTSKQAIELLQNDKNLIANKISNNEQKIINNNNKLNHRNIVFKIK